MRKKFTAAIMVAMTVMLLLAGCGEEKKSEEYASEFVAGTYHVVEDSSEEHESESDSLSIEALDTNRYYYKQLSEDGKIIYDSILKSKEKFINNEEVTVCAFDSLSDDDMKLLGTLISEAYSACLRDNPEVSMWLNNFSCELKSMYVCNENHEYIGMEYIVNIIHKKGSKSYSDFDSPEETRKGIEEVETKTKEFVKTLVGLSDEEKTIQIHNWILEDAVYDETVSVPNLRSVYGAVIQKECVCAGFAYAFKYVGDMAGLDVISVSGTGMDPNSDESGPHAWNNIYLNDKWYLVDLTWDCEGIPIWEESEKSYGGEHIRITIRSYTIIDTEYSDEYLLKDLSETINTHIPEDSFKVPTP